MGKRKNILGVFDFAELDKLKALGEYQLKLLPKAKLEAHLFLVDSGKEEG